jgi:ABC-type transporter Mla MlaB component
MKSEARKRTTRNKTGATDKDPGAAINTSEADADYATQLLADAEALLSSGSESPQPALEPSVVKGSVPVAQMNSSASAKANAVVSKPAKQSGVNETIAATVVLPVQCLMRDAVDLKLQLLPQLEAEDTVQIDVSKVERIDASVMQVLLAFVRDRTQRQRQVEWLGMNDVIAEAARLLGLQSVLQLPVEAA